MDQHSTLVVKLMIWTFILVSNVSSNNVLLLPANSSTGSCSLPPNAFCKCPDWDYTNITAWSKCYPTCAGRSQSPINIITARAVKTTRLPPFRFVNYDRIVPSAITNNGHSLVYQLRSNVPANQIPRISGGGLNGTYNFVSMHWHWSNSLTTGGSDHQINGRLYPVELHLVHMNSKYRSVGDAVKNKDGLAVLGIFMERTQWSNIPMRHIINLVNSNNMTIGKIVNVTIAFPLMDVLPDSTDTFYRYSGSLTTPACQESVTWTLFDTTLPISQRQIVALATLKDEDGVNLKYNNRGVQPLYNRVVNYRVAN